MPSEPRLTPPSTDASNTPGQRPERIDSRTLLRDGRELIIAHQGEEYRLRLTRQEKLILTK
ncbi:hemin uptake protein HemP [Rhodocyclus tenuis]|uniref:Hemin uptake protein HemP n=2 Tax=Rhodocyclus TaxID=1064 RepID=A0A6L5JVS6_RHOTE|nr:hemin uptake protein HemP [Rhodocyclus gracilis]MQY50278.1 hemin uptake protein HemP [Rhodocyclus gracilis]NJA87781.1 hemin uptake protein HemP [Rhodocyclus gracilis]